MCSEYRERLLPVLEEARRRGFLGPGPVGGHLDHAEGFAEAIRSHLPPSPDRAVDLGSGGGVPGLALALEFPSTRWWLVDAAQRRTAFLQKAVDMLDLDGRVEVVTIRAEELGRLPEHRGRYQVVVARGFGPPAVTAECAAPLLEGRGRLVVSEPPEERPGRWPDDGLAVLGMATDRVVRAAGASFQILVQASPSPERYPRRVGVPGKRPLF